MLDKRGDPRLRKKNRGNTKDSVVQLVIYSGNGRKTGLIDGIGHRSRHSSTAIVVWTMWRMIMMVIIVTMWIWWTLWILVVTGWVTIIRCSLWWLWLWLWLLRRREGLWIERRNSLLMTTVDQRLGCTTLERR